MMEKVWLGLGSNKGDSPAILRAVLNELETSLSECRHSGLWRSRARYYEDQEDFFNMAVCGMTDLNPRELLKKINEIETRFGRNRSKEIKKGPRTIDIDILLYGQKIITEPDLIIPHPGLAERKFALLPLLELDYELCHPGMGISIKQLAASLPPQGIYPVNDCRYDGPYSE
ncbi:MAG: 2-amino-4-hydroxy-6-hydroxymethyldihydropteridine diphosphokinase [Rectinema sp.]|jgi:2-amino-4-hydroxy-6-hydroxymethyldihydropteridine diphosphokinase